MSNYNREIYNLSNEEIIGLVDFLFSIHNLDRIAEYVYEERPDLTRNFTYRKIEVVFGLYEWSYIVRVTFGLEGLDRKITTGFYMQNNGEYEDDFSIQSVAGFFRPLEGVVFQPGVGQSFGIDIDFGVFQISVKQLYDYLNDTLQMWSSELPPEKYRKNPQIQGMLAKGAADCFTIEEITYPVESIAEPIEDVE